MGLGSTPPPTEQSPCEISGADMRCFAARFSHRRCDAMSADRSAPAYAATVPFMAAMLTFLAAAGAAGAATNHHPLLFYNPTAHDDDHDRGHTSAERVGSCLCRAELIQRRILRLWQAGGAGFGAALSARGCGGVGGGDRAARDRAADLWPRRRALGRAGLLLLLSACAFAKRCAVLTCAMLVADGCGCCGNEPEPRISTGQNTDHVLCIARGQFIHSAVCEAMRPSRRN